MATQPADDSGQLALLVDLLAAEVVAQYVQAEQELIAEVAAIARKGIAAPVGSAARLDMLRRMQDVARRIAIRLHLQSGPLAQQVIDEAVRKGAAAGARRVLASVASHPDLLSVLTAPQPEPVTSHALASAIRIRLDLMSQLDAAALRITRFADDAYRAAIARASIEEILAGGSPAAFQRAAWDDLMSKGITGFTDVRGRRWNLASYVEMATRTNVQRAYNAAHLDRMLAAGVDLFTVAPHAHPCPLCQPWEGKPMSALEVDAARAAGLFHPNAILGNQSVRVLGHAQAGSKAWYSGPSVNLTTARGHHLSVSPNHPVLTTDGWLPAKSLTKGLHVFSAGARDGAEATAVADVHLDDPHTTFQHELDALAAGGSRTAIASPGDDFHGDGRFLQGEVEVVVADRRLLPILDPESVEFLCEHGLPRADVQAASRASAGSSLLDSLSVDGSITGALADGHLALLEASQHRLAADAETVPQILSGLSAGVEPDELVDVQWDRFEGHAFDLQTSTGAYLAGSILAHNCTHTLVAYFEGVTRFEPKPWTAKDQAAYDAAQRLRALERRVRAFKQQEVGALTPLDRKRAAARVRAAQADIRAHIARTGLVRRPRREQLNLGHS